MGHDHKIVICRPLVLTTHDDIVLMTRFKDEKVSCQEHIISTQRYACIYIYIYMYVYIYMYIYMHIFVVKLCVLDIRTSHL